MRNDENGVGFYVVLESSVEMSNIYLFPLAESAAVHSIEVYSRVRLVIIESV